MKWMLLQNYAGSYYVYITCSAVTIFHFTYTIAYVHTVLFRHKLILMKLSSSSASETTSIQIAC